MDLELLCLTSTLNKRQARRFPADSHQRTGPCDLTIHVKESLIVFGNMFYSSDGVGGGGGFGRCFPLFLICWQNKFVGRRYEECVGACITAHFASDPIVSALRRSHPQLSAQTRAVIMVNFDAFVRSAVFLKSPPCRLFPFHSFIAADQSIMKGCKMHRAA